MRDPADHFYLNPHFKAAIRASQTPGWKLALLAGFTHQTRFSTFLHSPAVPRSAMPLFRRVAELVGFPPDQISVGNLPAETWRLTGPR